MFDHGDVDRCRPPGRECLTLAANEAVIVEKPIASGVTTHPMSPHVKVLRPLNTLRTLR